MSKEDSSEEVAQGGAGGEAGKKDPNADIYENRGSKKLIRLITVMAYMFSVSFVAIVLSAYYIFLWEPPNPTLLRNPVHLSGEPEVQFLLSDPPIMPNQSKQLQSNNLFPNSISKKFTGRIADDTSDINDLVSDPDQATKNPGKLDESLFLLRNSLMEFLRNRGNDSKPDRNSSPKTWGTSNFTKYASLQKGRRSNLTEKSSEESPALKNVGESEMTSKDIISSEVSDNGTSPTLVSSSISGDEANKDRFMDTRNSAMYKSSQYGYLLNRNSTENSAVIQGRRGKNIPASFRPENETSTINKSINITMDTGGNTSAINQNSGFDSFSHEFTNIARTFTIINKSDRITTPRNIEKPEIQRNRVRVHHIGLPVNNQSAINSSDNSEFTQQSDLSSVKPTNVAVVNFKDCRPRMQLPRKMSAQNVMASISRTLGNREHKATGNEIRLAGYERKDKLYEPKHKQKLVRVLTVVAYVIFVSMAAILLSLYYTFLWDPKDVSIRLRAKPECATVKLTNPLTTPSTVNETQMEKMTTKPMTMGNEQTAEPEIATTQRRKDLITILTESTEMLSSSVAPLTISQDFPTDPSTESDEKSTKTGPDST